MQNLIDVMIDLESGVTLNPQQKERPLSGDYVGNLECHIGPDWLLIYQIDDETKEVYFARTGTHSDLF